MHFNDASPADGLNLLLSQIASAKKNQILFYPENSLRRIHDEQMSVFYEECIKEGLLVKEGPDYHLTPQGLSMIRQGDASQLVIPYHRAKKRINLLYVDILI
jgi:hypothetical protein